jgi:hypothetical protein
VLESYVANANRNQYICAENFEGKKPLGVFRCRRENGNDVILKVTLS